MPLPLRSPPVSVALLVSLATAALPWLPFAEGKSGIALASGFGVALMIGVSCTLLAALAGILGVLGWSVRKLLKSPGHAHDSLAGPGVLTAVAIASLLSALAALSRYDIERLPPGPSL